MVRTEEILRFPQDDGLLFNHVWGKTLTDGASNVFGIRRHLKAIETYVAVVTELRVSVTNGYLFRPTNPQGHIVNKPFTSSSAEARLKLYLKEAQIDEGKTALQLPFGLSHNISMIWLPVGQHNVLCGMEQQRHGSLLHETGGGASFRQSADCYTDCSTTSALTENYMELNRLKNFVSAFPHTS